jgi:hypothetical protein
VQPADNIEGDVEEPVVDLGDRAPWAVGAAFSDQLRQFRVDSEINWRVDL